MDERAWLKQAVKCLGPFPRNFLCIDLETSGLSPTRNLPVEIGWAECVDGVVVDNGSAVLAWDRHPDVDHREFRRSLEATHARMAEKGKGYTWTPDRVAQGGDPVDVLSGVLARLIDCTCNNGWGLVAHNSPFDVSFLQSAFSRFLHYPWTPPECLFDTGAYVRGSRIPVDPHPGETPGAYAKRCLQVPSRVTWSLDRTCVPAYNLQEKYGVDPELLHGARADALATAYLLAELRTLSES